MLNNYEYENEIYELNDIKQFLRDDIIPEGLNAYQKRKFRKQFGDFELLNNRTLSYNNKIYIEPDDREAKLNLIYNDVLSGNGRGLNAFHMYIDHNFIGITREMSRAFLKNQQQYQLTKQVQKSKVPVKKAKKENNIHYMDLIDMNRNTANNRGYRYILSLLDSYSRKIVLFKLKNKDDTFETLSTHYDGIGIYPRILASDRGSEFKNNQFREFANENSIKLKYSESYTPVVSIEIVNKEVRRLLSQTFVKNKNLIWYNKLDDIERNINNFIDESYKPEDNPPPTENPYNYVGKVGDKLRIKTSVMSSGIRKLNKIGQQKHVHIKWSVTIFNVVRVIMDRRGQNPLPKYQVISNEGGLLVHENDGKPYYLKHSDAQFIIRSENNNVTEEDEMRLNNVNELVEEYIDNDDNAHEVPIVNDDNHDLPPPPPPAKKKAKAVRKVIEKRPEDLQRKTRSKDK